MKKEAFFQLLEKYEQGACNLSEKKLIDDFFNSFERDPGRYEHWDIEAKEKVRIDILFKMRIRLGEHIEKKSGWKSVWWKVASAAAVLFMLIGSWVLLNRSSRSDVVSYITKTTKRGEKATVLLSDSTVVTLNSESTIKFPEKFSGKSREIELVGEAFFQVKRDVQRPFTVQSGKLLIQVLGTSFNINAYKGLEEAKVTVATGKVSISSGSDASQSKMILLPNEQGVFSQTKGDIQKRNVDLKSYLDWKNGIIRFQNHTLKEALETLERWYDVEIITSDVRIDECYVTGVYQNESLSSVLKSLKFISRIDYKMINEHKIVIVRSHCQK